MARANETGTAQTQAKSAFRRAGETVRTALKLARESALRDVNIDRIVLLVCAPLVVVAIVALTEPNSEAALATLLSVAKILPTLYSAGLGILILGGHWRSARDLFLALVLLGVSSHASATAQVFQRLIEAFSSHPSTP